MTYGCIARRLSHSYSRELHGLIGNYEYEMLELDGEGVAALLSSRELLAVNVTIPYKETVIPYLDELSNIAREVGAVNTIVNRGGVLYGYNTDYPALYELILRSGVDIRGKKVLILGTGGTSRTARAVLKKLLAGSVITVSRTAGEGRVTYADALLYHTDADVIINATPVGMYPEESLCPINIKDFKRLSLIVDAIYNPLRTRLMLDGEARGICTVGGLYMLAHQALSAARLFPGAEVGSISEEELYQAMRSRKENVVLIGMPGVGKSTVGRLVAKALGREFLDTDDLIFQKYGKSPAEIIRCEGVGRLRMLEGLMLDLLSGVTGAVISTGGGTVEVEGAREKLCMRGRVFLLDRSVHKLTADETRPLSSTEDALFALYERRMPLYRALADETVNADGGAEAAAEAIARLYKIKTRRQI